MFTGFRFNSDDKSVDSTSTVVPKEYKRKPLGTLQSVNAKEAKLEITNRIAIWKAKNAATQPPRPIDVQPAKSNHNNANGPTELVNPALPFLMHGSAMCDGALKSIVNATSASWSGRLVTTPLPTPEISGEPMRAVMQIDKLRSIQQKENSSSINDNGAVASTPLPTPKIYSETRGAVKQPVEPEVTSSSINDQQPISKMPKLATRYLPRSSDLYLGPTEMVLRANKLKSIANDTIDEIVQIVIFAQSALYILLSAVEQKDEGKAFSMYTRSLDMLK